MLTGGRQAERKAAVRACLETLADTVDAVADLLLAESVHQLVAGNPERAGASLGTLAGGDHPPPEPEIVRTPRAGQALTHRVLVATDASVPAAAGWAAGGARAAAEPRLERWAGHLLGDPRTVEVHVVFDAPPSVQALPVISTAPPAPVATPDAGPAPNWPVTVAFPLSDLRVGALDV